MILVPSWRETTLGELVDGGTAELQTGPFGTMLHASSYREAGTPVVAVKHIGDNKIIHSDMPRIDEETSTRLEKYTLLKDDILFARKGAVSRRALVRAAEEGWIQGSDCIRLRLDSREISPPYVSYCLGTRSHKRWIEQHAHGATMPSLNQEILKLIPLALPDKPTQDGIAHILGTLDDKIELNWRMNRTLEAIARAIFKSWFIDFDPVIDNAILNGKPIPDEFATRAEVRREVLARSKPSPPAPLPKVEGRQSAPELGEVGPSPYERGGDEDVADYAMSGSSPSGRGTGEGVAACRHLFPDEFQDSPLGMIPKGWEASTVGDEFDVTMGQSPPGSTYNEEGDGLPFFQGRRDFGFRYPTRRIFCTTPKRIAETGDTLVSVRAPVGDVNMAPERLCVGRGLAGVRHATGSRSYTYYSMLSLQDRFREYESEGTVFGAINKSQFAGLECIGAPSDVVAAFEGRLFAMDETIQLNEIESAKLASVRDFLLPELLLGRLGALHNHKDRHQ